jgi:hypothetical protein
MVKAEEIFDIFKHDIPVGEIHKKVKEFLSATGPLTLEELHRLTEVDGVRLLALLSSPPINQDVEYHKYGGLFLYYLKEQKRAAKVRNEKDRLLVFKMMKKRNDGFKEIVNKLEDMREGGKIVDMNGACDGGIDALRISPNGFLIYQYKNMGQAIPRKIVDEFIGVVQTAVEAGKVNIRGRTYVGLIVKAKFYTSTTFTSEAKTHISRWSHMIEFIDGIELVKMLTNYGLLEDLRKYLS